MQTPTQSRMIVKNPIGPSSVLSASRTSAVQKIKKLSKTPGTKPIVAKLCMTESKNKKIESKNKKIA